MSGWGYLCRLVSELIGKGHNRNFWGDGNMLYFDEGLGYKVYTFVKTHQSMIFFPSTVYKLCLKNINKYSLLNNIYTEIQIIIITRTIANSPDSLLRLVMAR